jgi:hypothetical protein
VGIATVCMIESAPARCILYCMSDVALLLLSIRTRCAS